MDANTSESGGSGQVFTRKDGHRLFAVLQIGGQEFTERIPLQILKNNERYQKWYLGWVTDRLIKRAGIKKVKTLISKDKPAIP